VLIVGQVVEVFDQWTRPQKPKWHICVCPIRLLFLRINSQPIWQPAYPLLKALNPFLDHDSYVELRQLLHFTPSEIATALQNPKNPLGRLTRAQARDLATAARAAKTLSEEWKDLVRQNLADPGY
jgi:hypothetical protein